MKIDQNPSRQADALFERSSVDAARVWCVLWTDGDTEDELMAIYASNEGARREVERIASGPGFAGWRWGNGKARDDASEAPYIFTDWDDESGGYYTVSERSVFS